MTDTAIHADAAPAEGQRRNRRLIYWIIGIILFLIAVGVALIFILGGLGKAQPKDLCPNIPGVQDKVPAGMVVDKKGNCVKAPAKAHPVLSAKTPNSIRIDEGPGGKLDVTIDWGSVKPSQQDENAWKKCLERGGYCGVPK